MKSRRALNPAFCAAHGLVAKDEEEDVKISRRTVPSSSAAAPTCSTTSSSHSNTHSKRLQHAIQEARRTGKLQATNLGLTHPLPDQVFDFRAGISVDLSMDNASTTVTTFEHGEETIVLVDFSDNDLSSHSHHGLDERVLKFEQVQVMRWKRCGLPKCLPVDCSASLEHLLVLDLEGNQLEHIDLSLLPPNLQELNLSKNKIAALECPPSKTTTTKLVSIDLSENILTSLDGLTGTIHWPHLQIFRCHHNPIKILPKDILESAKQSLQTLDLSYCQLQEQDDKHSLDLSEFTKLEAVLLSFNRLAKVPTISTSTKRLDLVTNRITTILGLFSSKNSTAESSSLLELLLQDNHLTEIDASVISKCQSLQRLDVSANKLKTLPYQMGFLPKLEHLSVTGNPLLTFKTSEISSTHAILSKLRNRAPKSTNDMPSKKSILSSSVLIKQQTTIEFSGQTQINVQHLAEELQSDPALAFGISGELILDKAKLTDSLPDELLSALVNLTGISLDHAHLSQMPPVLFRSCSKLLRISMQGNTIMDIPPLPLLPPWASTLQHLDMSNNRLTRVSGDFLASLTNLQVLKLAFNSLKSLADWQRLSPQLVTLDLSENSIETMDDLILIVGAHCPRLETLLVPHNCIARIPAMTGLLLERCPSLKWLDLKGNPQRGIRHEVLTKSTPEQLTYLHNRLTKEQQELALEQMDRLSQGHGKPDSAAIPRTPARKKPAPQRLIQTKNVSMEEDIPKSSNVVAEPSRPTSSAPIHDEEEVVSILLQECQSKIAQLQLELESPSLSQAKHFAVKKALTLERSKLIREERRLGLRT